jgi:hypothetical protein
MKVKRNTGGSKTCAGCSVVFNKKPKHTYVQWEGCKYCSQACYSESRIGVYGAGIGRWKGDNVGYAGIHQWLLKHYGSPDHCEGLPDMDCRNTGGYEWAVIHEKGYERKRENFRRLCVSCHRRYDAGVPWNKGAKKMRLKICEFCGIDFNAAIDRRRYCSNSCSVKSRFQEGIKSML